MTASLAGRLGLLALLSVSPAAAQDLAEIAWVPVAVTTTPIPTFATGSPEARFGELDYVGGLVLASEERIFSSLSGLSLGADGTLLAINDRGLWFRARLTAEDGVPTGITGPEMAPLVDSDGRLPVDKGEADAEGLRVSGDHASVVFERDERVLTYPLADLLSTPTLLRPENLPVFPYNQGIEAIAIATAPPLGDAIVLVGEVVDDGAGNLMGWVIGGARAGAFSIVRSDGFAVSDADFLPNGDLLLLERSFSLLRGMAMRLRRIAADDIRPGAVVDGPVVMAAGRGYEIDNMEGVSVEALPGGDAYVTLVSDDNGNAWERTLLLRFRWTPPGNRAGDDRATAD